MIWLDQFSLFTLSIRFSRSCGGLETPWIWYLYIALSDIPHVHNLQNKEGLLLLTVAKVVLIHSWHDMDPWLFPNEIQHYLGQTFNARSSGIVDLRNHSIGGHSPKSIFTLWQLWINICIFFQKFFWLFEQCPVQPLWVLGMRCLHLPVRLLSKVLLLPVWVWLVLPSTAYSKSMLPLDIWCQASLQGLPERQHLGKTVHCWGWSDRIVSWVLGPWRRRWEICTEWGMVAQRLTTDSCPVVTGHIDPQRSPCWLPTTFVSAWSGRRGGGTWQLPTGSMSSSVMSRDFNFTR